MWGITVLRGIPKKYIYLISGYKIQYCNISCLIEYARLNTKLGEPYNIIVIN